MNIIKVKIFRIFFRYMLKQILMETIVMGYSTKYPDATGSETFNNTRAVRKVFFFRGMATKRGEG